MTIPVEIFGRNLEVSDRINDHVIKKVSKLDRYLSGIEEARVDLGYSQSARDANDRYVTQITVRGKGVLLRAEERSADIYTAMDAAMSKIQRRITRFKGKRDDGRTKRPEEFLPDEIVEFEEEPVIARRKRFTMIPMSEQEAIDQMMLLGHDNFFIFYNADTHRTNVLYRRRDGELGLIEPEIG